MVQLQPDAPMHADSFLQKVFALSYRYIWIFCASIFFFSLINYVSARFGLANPVISLLFGFALSELFQRTLGTVLWRALEWFIRTSDNPLPPRLYFLIDGWAAVVTAIVIIFVADSVFHIDIPYAPGPYEYLTGAAAIVFVATLAYSASNEENLELLAPKPSHPAATPPRLASLGRSGDVWGKQRGPR